MGETFDVERLRELHEAAQKGGTLKRSHMVSAADAKLLDYVLEHANELCALADRLQEADAALANIKRFATGDRLAAVSRWATQTINTAAERHASRAREESA